MEKLKFLVTVEVDYEMYHLLLNKGYAHNQIYHNIAVSIRNMFSGMLKHWDSAIRDINVEEIHENGVRVSSTVC